MRADRAPDGTLKVTMRGELFDGRGFIKSATSSSASGEKGKPPRDFDLDVKLGTDHRLQRRGAARRRAAHVAAQRPYPQLRHAGQARQRRVALGRPARLSGRPPGDLFARSNDAGALLRFTDTYSRVIGGQMWVAMDPPTTDQLPQEGVLNVRDFSIRGESELQRVAGSDPSGPKRAAEHGAGVDFSRMRAEFTRSPGKLALREGVVLGPGDGRDARRAIRLRARRRAAARHLHPGYALNNFLARVPLVGLIIGGGQNEGIFGMTYEVAGPPGNATLRVMPMSMLAPGIFRKIFEFRGARERPQRGAAVSCRRRDKSRLTPA